MLYLLTAIAMDIPLGASSQQVLNQYLAWGKQAQGRCSADLSFSSQQFTAGRILPGTVAFPNAEVKQILHDHYAKLDADVQKDEESLVSGSSELIKVLLAECDRHRVPTDGFDPLQILMSGVARSASSAVEAAELRIAGSGRGRGLAPLTAADRGDPTALALQRANEEVARLNEKVRKLQDAATEAARQRSATQQGALRQQDEVANLRANASALENQHKETLARLTALHHDDLVKTHADTLTQYTNLEKDYQAQCARLSTTVSELTHLQQEMSNRLAASSQFQNIKRILGEKNDLVKRFRAALTKYSPAEAAAIGGAEEDDIEAVDSDSD